VAIIHIELLEWSGKGRGKRYEVKKRRKIFETSEEGEAFDV